MMPKKFGKTSRFWGLASAAASVCLSVAMAHAGPASRSRLADQLIDDARSIGRNTAVPSDRAADIATDLLQTAVRLNPKSATGYRLLADAASSINQPALRVKALLMLCKLEPGNIVAQMQLLDSLAAARQSVGGRLAVYLAALKAHGSSSQLDSMIALRLGELYSVQARKNKASAFFVRAVELNPANIDAWRLMLAELKKSGAPAGQQMYVIVQALQCDPYQPAILESGAKILAQHRLYALAASWANESIQQYQKARRQLSPGFAGNLAAYWQMAGKSRQAHAYLSELTALRHPTAATLSLALAVTCKGHSATGNLPKLLLTRLKERLRQAIKATKSPILKADLVWLTVRYAPKMPTDINARVAQLEKLLGPKNPIYLRIHGWQLMRQLYFGAAQEKLAAAGKDAYAQIGLARLAAQGGHFKNATRILQHVWVTAPSTLIALQAYTEAQRLEITLKPPAAATKLLALANSYPSNMLHVLAHPDRVILQSVHMIHRSAHAGEPMFVRVDFYNASPCTLAVGPNAAISTSVAMVARLEGLTDQNLGAYAVDANPQIVSLDSSSTLEVTYRLDQGTLRSILIRHPISMLGGKIEIITNPIIRSGQVFPGLGGDAMSAGYFNVSGMAPGAPTAITDLAEKLPNLSSDQGMLATTALARALPQYLQLAASGNSGHRAAAKAAGKIRAALMTVLANPDDANLQAWLLRTAPVKGLPRPLMAAMDNLIHSPSQPVRVFAYLRLYSQARAGAQGRKIAAELTAAAAKETAAVPKNLALHLARQALVIANTKRAHHHSG